ncbi:interferon alpha/beta receptor 2-like [Parambassis ranga]|uniref:Interferon alpha/beta receptor 2-like n=1 Tax=Parambassis ranga TaxID=210632 RepID=A0A6P7H4W6_9TELE|nr:interferon alpha/beta receptor 2-like [Parambassis ranga]
MGLWTLLLLHIHFVMCISISSPSNVSISSFNMEHTLSFLPGPKTPSDAYFRVQIYRSRKHSWRPVEACLKLVAGQMCNLTRPFKDPFDHYQARVQAVTFNQTSNWTVSEWFQPLLNTLVGPPGVSVSGCGYCLILQLTVPRIIQQNLHLDIYREFTLHVQRTRDGAQFMLSVPYKEKTIIPYLQPGMEYCVTVTAKLFFNHNTIASKPVCAFTSPPSSRESLYRIFGFLGAICVLAFLLMGHVIYGSQLSFKLLNHRWDLKNPLFTIS